jgi:hypothetical protein
MIQSYRSYLWSSPPPGDLALRIGFLIVIGSLVPFADLVAAPLLIYAGLQIRAQRGLDPVVRLIGQAAFGMGIVTGALALWSLVMLAAMFAPGAISAG